MEEYIKRETAVDAILGEPTDAHYPEWYASILMGLPAADVAPVVHGRWEIVIGSNKKQYMVCSECRVSQTLTGVFSYCPNCGVKMDGDN